VDAAIHGRAGFPENRENNREFLEISHHSGLLGRLWKPVAKRIQRVAADSLFLRKQGIFLSEQGIFSPEQRIVGLLR
jgi:hypothetical protein